MIPDSLNLKTLFQIFMRNLYLIMYTFRDKSRKRIIQGKN
jgi:hypothetical protein